MPKWIILAIGVLVATAGRVNGQDEVPPSTSSAPRPSDNAMASTDSTMSNDGLFVSTNQDYWITADYLFGWIQGDQLPRLVTTSPSTVTDPRVAGVLGQSTTSVLLNGRVNQDVRSGLRLGFGYVFDQEYGQAVEAGFMYLPSQSSDFSLSSADHPILARPFYDVRTDSPTPAAVLVAFPGQSTGSINVDSRSGAFYGANLDLSEKVWDNNGVRVDALLGYRFASFSDGLRMGQHIVSSTLPGTVINSSDDFQAQNVFNGLDLGARTTFTWNRLSLNLLGKVAVGNLNRTVNISGHQVVNVTGADPVRQSGGVYALSSNSGRHNDGSASLLPEAGANLSWQLRSNLCLRLGYSVLVLNQVVRAADQIDFTINPDLFPPAKADATPRRPTYHEFHSDLWIQTLNLGAEWKF